MERIGIERSWQEIRRADVVLLLRDASRLAEAPAAIDGQLPAEVERINVVNKIDLAGGVPARMVEEGRVTIHLSAKRGDGIELLRAELLRVAGWHAHGEDVILARERHLQALREARRVVRAGGRLHALEHGVAPEEPVRRWQRRLEPVQRAVAGGCHLTRDVPALVEAAGWRVEELDQAYLPGPALARPWTYGYRLEAV